MELYLDLFNYHAVCGNDFPVNSWGPGTADQISDLVRKLMHRPEQFDRLEITRASKGCAVQSISNVECRAEL